MAEVEGSKGRGYHHGDLRRALVEAAAAILAEAGVDALTLRGVGDRVGVSRTALYRHFDSKAALLAAVATEGFRSFRRALEAALQAAPADAGARIAALGRAYVAFGAEHPTYYRTMFATPITGKDHDPDLAAEGRAAFGVLVAAIAEGQAAGRFGPGDPVRLAQVFWAAVHGVVQLTDSGRIDGPVDGPKGGPPLADLVSAMLLTGLEVR